MDKDSEAMDAMNAGIAETNRLARGEFDGLLGSLPTGTSLLLSDILDELRWVVLEHYSDEETLALLEERRPQLRPDGLSSYRNCTVVPEEVELALRLLNLIGSANRCEGDRFLKFLLGPAGLRDTKRQAGTRQPRRPDIDEWILKQLQRNPCAKSPALWAMAPESITDQVGQGRFSKRVTTARKKMKADASK